MQSGIVSILNINDASAAIDEIERDIIKQREAAKNILLTQELPHMDYVRAITRLHAIEAVLASIKQRRKVLQL